MLRTDLVVGLFVLEHVVVVAQPELEAAVLVDQLVPELAALLGRLVLQGLGVDVVGHAAEGGVAEFEHLLEAALLLHLVVLGRVNLLLVHGEGVVGRALVGCQLCCVSPAFLDHLHATGPGADDGNALALEVNVVLRPFLKICKLRILRRGMVYLDLHRCDA